MLLLLPPTPSAASNAFAYLTTRTVLYFGHGLEKRQKHTRAGNFSSKTRQGNGRTGVRLPNGALQRARADQKACRSRGASPCGVRVRTDAAAESGQRPRLLFPNQSQGKPLLDTLHSSHVTLIVLSICYTQQGSGTYTKKNELPVQSVVTECRSPHSPNKTARKRPLHSCSSKGEDQHALPCIQGCRPNHRRREQLLYNHARATRATANS